MYQSKGKKDLFDNFDADAVLRAFVSTAMTILRAYLKETYNVLPPDTSLVEVEVLWRSKLPCVKNFNQLVTSAMAQDVKRMHPHVEASTKALAMLYSTYAFGTTPDGRINILEGSTPPLRDLFHAYFVSVCLHPAVQNLEVFKSYTVMEECSRGALLDALRFVMQSRVHIKRTVTRDEYAKEREGGCGVAPPNVASPKRSESAEQVRLTTTPQLPPRAAVVVGKMPEDIASVISAPWMAELRQKSGPTSGSSSVRVVPKSGGGGGGGSGSGSASTSNSSFSAKRRVTPDDSASMVASFARTPLTPTQQPPPQPPRLSETAPPDVRRVVLPDTVDAPPILPTSRRSYEDDDGSRTEASTRPSAI